MARTYYNYTESLGCKLCCGSVYIPLCFRCAIIYRFNFHNRRWWEYMMKCIHKTRYLSTEMLLWRVVFFALDRKTFSNFNTIWATLYWLHTWIYNVSCVWNSAVIKMDICVHVVLAKKLNRIIVKYSNICIFSFFNRVTADFCTTFWPH